MKQNSSLNLHNLRTDFLLRLVGSVLTIGLLLFVDLASAQRSTPEADRRDLVYLYTTGITLQRLGNRQDAVSVLQQAWQKGSGSVEIGLAYARSLAELRQFQDALHVVDSLPKDQTEVLLMHAYLLRALGRNVEAMADYRQVAALDTSNVDALSMLASFYLENKRNDSAVVVLQRLGRLNPNNPRAWNEAGRIQVEQNDLTGAKESFRHSVQADATEQNFDGVFGLARVEWVTGRADSALPWGKLVVQYRPNEADGYRMLASLYGSLDSTAQAIRVANDGLGVRPRDPDLRRVLGLLYFDADSLLEGEQVFRGLIQDSIADHVAYRVLSQIKLKQGDTTAALAMADQGTIHFPHLASVWLNLADLERRRGHPEQGVAALRDGLKSVPTAADSGGLQAVAGDMLAQMKHYNDAYASYEAALKVSPEDATLLNNYGYLLADRGERLNDALRLIKKAHDLRPEASFINDSYGWVLFRTGDLTKALTYLMKADSLAPNAETSEHIGDVYKAKRDTAKAQEWWQRSVQQNPDRPGAREKLSKQ